MQRIIHAMVIGAIAGAAINAIAIMIFFTQEKTMYSNMHHVTAIKIDTNYISEDDYSVVKVTVESDKGSYELSLFTKDATKIPGEVG